MPLDTILRCWLPWLMLLKDKITRIKQYRNFPIILHRSYALISLTRTSILASVCVRVLAHIAKYNNIRLELIEKTGKQSKDLASYHLINNYSSVVSMILIAPAWKRAVNIYHHRRKPLPIRAPLNLNHNAARYNSTMLTCLTDRQSGTVTWGPFY